MSTDFVGIKNWAVNRTYKSADDECPDADRKRLHATIAFGRAGARAEEQCYYSWLKKQ